MKKKRYKGRVRHHIKNKCRGGDNSPENLLLMKTEKEVAWHKLFGNRDIDETIAFLKRQQSIRKKIGGSHV